MFCEPPFKLIPFPSEAKNPVRRKQWILNVNRQDVKTGELWTPSGNGRICSNHFVDGKPTEANPNPTLFMGQAEPPLKKTKTTKLETINKGVRPKKIGMPTSPGSEGKELQNSEQTTTPASRASDLLAWLKQTALMSRNTPLTAGTNGVTSQSELLLTSLVPCLQNKNCPSKKMHIRR